MPEHRADCTDCSWSFRDEDLVDVSDEMERHARKEQHHVDLQRAVATDGGQSVDGTEREDREVRAAMASAIHHMETIESSLENIDAQKNREARIRLEKALESLRDRSVDTGANQEIRTDGGVNQLDWPEGFDRTSPGERESYPHGFRVSRTSAFENILEELRKMDARNVQVKTAAPHTVDNPHRPYADRDPDDPGVVIYFERDGQQFAVPCDRWDNLRDNAQAIAKYLDAKRALERYGVQTVESEFSTQALPSGDEDVVAGGEPPHEILEVSPDADEKVVRAAARELKKVHHPDQGGDGERLQQIIAAEEAMLDD